MKGKAEEMSYMVPTAFQAWEEVFGPRYLTDLHTQCWQVRIPTFFLPLLKGSTDRAGILLAQASQTWASVTSLLQDVLNLKLLC